MWITTATLQRRRAPVEPEPAGHCRTPAEHAAARGEGCAGGEALLIALEHEHGCLRLHLQLGRSHCQRLAVLLRFELRCERGNLATQFGDRLLIRRLLLVGLGRSVGRLQRIGGRFRPRRRLVVGPAGTRVGLASPRVEPRRLALLGLKPPERESHDFTGYTGWKVGHGRARRG